LTDRLVCPECGGTGEQIIGTLRLGCLFCGGRGYVGDDNEPAEDTPPPDMPDPVWEHPAAQGLPLCPRCLGAGKVVNLGGTGEPTGKLVELPCPACSGRAGG
jgi:RecJ-like exonuclease